MGAAEPPLVKAIVVSLAAAYAAGLFARTVRLPAIAGYLVAGIVLGPLTRGLLVEQQTIEQLAEIGVALLLFGVGLHFSFRDLVAVWRVAVPGALVQVAAAAGLAFGIGRLIGLGPEPARLFAACLAVSSTAVATRWLRSRQQLQTLAGRVALGWLVMQDLMVIALLVLLPDNAGAIPPLGSMALALLGIKIAEVLVYGAAMLLIGRRLIPWLLAHTARDGSQELFRLAVIVVALGIAYVTTELIGVSLALGAFFAGVVIADSDVSHHAAGESVPVQQVFTVLFFVSVGMLFDPAAVTRDPWGVGAATATVVAANLLITLLVLLVLREPPRAAVEVAVALAQIGEFSFILSGTAVARGLLPVEARDMVIAAALFSILLQPVMFRLADALGSELDKIRPLRRWHSGRGQAQQPKTAPALRDHAIIVGHGRVGSVIAESLRRHGIRYVVVEQDLNFAETLRREDIHVIYGDAAWPEVLDAAAPDRARMIVIAVPDKSAARRILATARRANPAIEAVVRTHSKDEAEWLSRHAAGFAVMSEKHAADEMAKYALSRLGEHPAGGDRP